MTVRNQHTLTDCGSAGGAITAVRGLGNQHWHAVFIDSFVVGFVVGQSSEKISQIVGLEGKDAPAHSQHTLGTHGMVQSDTHTMKRDPL